jgi:hypothetical protein
MKTIDALDLTLNPLSYTTDELITEKARIVEIENTKFDICEKILESVKDLAYDGEYEKLIVILIHGKNLKWNYAVTGCEADFELQSQSDLIFLVKLDEECEFDEIALEKWLDLALIDLNTFRVNKQLRSIDYHRKPLTIANMIILRTAQNRLNVALGKPPDLGPIRYRDVDRIFCDLCEYVPPVS